MECHRAGTRVRAAKTGSPMRLAIAKSYMGRIWFGKHDAGIVPAEDLAEMLAASPFRAKLKSPMSRGFEGMRRAYTERGCKRGEEIGKREPFLSFALLSNCTTHF